MSLDFKVAYLKVPIHPDSRKYLRFIAFSQVYEFKALCFGLSMAPQVFNRVMAPVSAFLHRAVTLDSLDTIKGYQSVLWKLLETILA